jgi:hypothetical protein
MFPGVPKNPPQCDRAAFACTSGRHVFRTCSGFPALRIESGMIGNGDDRYEKAQNDVPLAAEIISPK